MHRDDPPIFELHVRPTYAVRIPQRSRLHSGRTKKQISSESNLKLNQLSGQLSAKAIRRLSNSVNWLVASAKKKFIYDKKSGKRFAFKINFITLTIPTLEHGLSDHEFKAKLLHNFINTCRYKYDLKNYVWKVEAQKNGNIHAHFTTDTFIHHKDLRDTWNRILKKAGILQLYTEKHSAMSFEDYFKSYYSSDSQFLAKAKKAYAFGTSTNWTSPNSTDVHAVHKVSDIAAYLAKYMSKNEKDRRKIKGRLWSCSTNLSEKNKLVIELIGSESYEYLASFMNPDIKYKVIESVNQATGVIKNVGEIFFFKISDWGKSLTGPVLEAFNEHRFRIRHNLPIDNEKYISVKPPPPVLVIEPNLFSKPVFNQLKFDLQ